MIDQRRKRRNYECKIIKELKQYFPRAITSKNDINLADTKGIDIINTGLFNVQCKARQEVNLFDILNKEMPADTNINIVFWKRNRLKDIVCISKQDFYKLLQILKTEHIFSTSLNCNEAYKHLFEGKYAQGEIKFKNRI